jgi:hypothetical protein
MNEPKPAFNRSLLALIVMTVFIVAVVGLAAVYFYVIAPLYFTG